MTSTPVNHMSRVCVIRTQHKIHINKIYKFTHKILKASLNYTIQSFMILLIPEYFIMH